MAGEAGEACDAIKKLNRHRDSVEKGVRRTKEELIVDIGFELADVIIYCDLLAQAAGIDLEEAIIQKFNKVSSKFDFPQKL